MTLRQKQSEFARCVVLLLQYATLLGYEVTFGDAYRDPRAPYGLKNGAHSKRLALDLNLFINGRYIRNGEGHDKLGAFWKKLNKFARWGGDFTRRDYNHYSFKHGRVS